MNAELPDFYDDLSLSLDHIRSILNRGSKDRRSAAHAPIVATVDGNGSPRQRVMILRHVDWPVRTLRFHTDARSGKVNELVGHDQASILVYDPKAKLQIRFGGSARILDGGEVEKAWAQSTPFARRCYMAEDAPGSQSAMPTSGLPEWIEGKMPDEDQLKPARGNFAVMHVIFDEIEWLYLANAGHRRAHWLWTDNGEWQGSWLIP